MKIVIVSWYYLQSSCARYDPIHECRDLNPTVYTDGFSHRSNWNGLSFNWAQLVNVAASDHRIGA
jgi:hypothetical protein